MTGRSKKYENEPIEDIPEGSDDTARADLSAEEPEKDEAASEETSASDSRIIELEKEVMDYRDKLIRKAAEFENYKKRTSDEFVRLIETANEDLLITLLPILDDVERFRKNYNPGLKTEDLKKGVDMIFDKLSSTLKNFGLEEIEALNNEFNPNDHDALMTMEKEGVGPNIVVGQHEKGFKLKNKVIRHSKVIVSK